MRKIIIIIVITVAVGYFINSFFRLPYDYKGCIDKYISDAKNDRAASAINRACRNLTNYTHIKFSKCMLENIDEAKTERSVEILIDNCREKYSF